MNRSNLFILQWLSFVLLLVNYTVVPCYSSELSMDIDNSQNGDIDSKPIIRLKPGEIPERPSGSTEIVKRRCKFCNKFKKELTIDEYIDPSGKHVKVILRRRYRPIFSGLRRWRQRKSTRARARKAFKNNKQKSLSKKFNKKKSDKRHPSQKNLQSLGIDKQDLSDGSAVPTEHSKDIKYSGINKMPDIEYNENDNISNIGYNKVDTLLSNEYSEADTLSNSEYSQTDKIPSLEYNQNSEDIFSNEVVTGINGSE